MVKKIYNKILNVIISQKAKKHPLSLTGHLELNEKNLKLNENKLIPRFVLNEIAYSQYHDIEYELLPKSILKVIIEKWDSIEKAIGGEAVIKSFRVYRNKHIPNNNFEKEAYSDAWHRDTIGVTNVQMFILTHDTKICNGALRYVKSENMRNVDIDYPKLKDPRFRSSYVEIDEKYVSYFEGKRGDYIILNTYNNYHSATIPDKGFKRDMISIGFEPRKITTWENILDIRKVKELYFSTTKNI